MGKQVSDTFIVVFVMSSPLKISLNNNKNKIKFLKQCLIITMGAGKVAWQVKMPATKP